MVIIKIIAVILVGLVAGGWMMGSFLVVPAQKNLNAQEYTAVEQANTSFGKRYFPIVVILSIITLAVLAYMLRGSQSQMILVAISLVLMVSALAFTGARMVPINNKIEAWSVQSPPENWQSVRDSWHNNHRVRTGIAATAFVLLTIAIVANSSSSTSVAQSAKRSGSSMRSSESV